VLAVRKTPLNLGASSRSGAGPEIPLDRGHFHFLKGNKLKPTLTISDSIWKRSEDAWRRFSTETKFAD